jgi:hypothetical protein
MEPVYMMLGHASGDATHLALKNMTPVQKVDAEALRALLLAEGAILDAGYQPQVKLAWLPMHPKAGERVRFTAVADTLKSPLKHVVWDFEGAGKVFAEGENVEHRFELEKVHTVCLLATDAVGRRRLVTAEVPVGTASAHDVTVDDFDAELTGRWDGTLPDYLVTKPLRYSDIFTGPGIHRDVIRQGQVLPARARFQPEIPHAGRYQVCLGFRPSKSQATNVPVTIGHAGGTAKLTVNQRHEATPFNFVPIGEFAFAAGDAGFVEVTNAGANGRVAMDGVRWVWLGSVETPSSRPAKVTTIEPGSNAIPN